MSLSLDRLVPGVDNIRYDVRLSPEFVKSSIRNIRFLIASHCNCHEIMQIDENARWSDFRDDFEKKYCELVLEAVNTAKAKREIQIDFLAQTAIAKALIEEIRNQYDYMIECFIKTIRKKELSSKRDWGQIIKVKEELSTVRLNRTSLLRNVGIELFQFIAEIQENNIKEVREANFGHEAVIHTDFFTNPILHVENAHDDFFMMDEYQILLGRRFDDPDRYASLIQMVRNQFRFLLEQDYTSPKDTPIKISSEAESKLESWIKQVRNFDRLLNYFDSKQLYKALKKKKRPKQDLKAVKEKMAAQKKLLNFFYRSFNHSGLIKKIVAGKHIQSVAKDYCPPLVPQQLVLFLVKPSKRRGIARQLRRSEKFYRKSFSLKPLKKCIRAMERTYLTRRKRIFLEFLKGFIRYHRDLENYKVLKEAMDYVNLARKDKIINLSRANNTLFEFLLPPEVVLQEKPIINHVILKADVRGSTEITLKLKSRDLNPASYFSLNFFDPITSILDEYGASKVFIEGDAVILGITEHEETPEGWYSVARACGLAMNMLSIVQRYNIQSKKHNLPVLELGIGICYSGSTPTFLFDGDNRIMISPAINQADRLSGCSRILRKRIGSAPKPFNLYVFESGSPKKKNSEGIYLRYNVNGIEMSSEAFKKLSEEIELKAIEAIFPEVTEERLNIFIGKYPTASGNFKKLIIRKAPIPNLAAASEKGISKTSRFYYEVCTNPRLFQYAKKLI